MKHTKGPWKVTEDRTRVQTMDDAPDYQIADCEDTHFAPPLNECEANARLIAAAPELLAACKRALQAISGARNGARPAKTECDVLQQVIAKAEGSEKIA